jgi:threonylcarbamoyladenosine tRNA methylthiotransferase MtaB
MKVAFYTLGCKVNTYESESVWEQFKTGGYERVDYKEYADVYVINTCTVTNNGDVKSRKAIRQLIKKNPEAVIAVMGCYSQMSPNEVIEIDGVDIVIGTKHREKLFDLVQEFNKKREQISSVTDVSRYKVFDEVNVTNFTENTRAFLKIQDGCNNFCTYCIIPFARGPVRSRPKESILEEAIHLVENGYHEIVLTGIHTGGYGQDLNNYSLYDLLLELSQINDLKRIRISSIEINELTDEIIDLIAANDIFAKHLHIPLQSGSEAILSSMKRKYNKAQFKAKIEDIRSRVSGIAITTDIIVGFPGETDEMFEEMKLFIEELEFSELHVFPYSKRNGTKAAQMKNQINGVIKSIRVNQLLKLNEELATKFIEKSKANEISVLFETSDDFFTYGHSDTYIYAKVKKDISLHNQIARCVILESKYKDTLCKIKEAYI